MKNSDYIEKLNHQTLPITIILLLLLFLLGRCSLKNNQLSLESIQKNIVLDKTTDSDLVEYYGQPDLIEKNKNKVKQEYNYWENQESGTDYLLEMDTNYWDDLKSSENIEEAHYPDSYYRYENNQVGLENITFYMKDNKVYYLHFGKIVDRNEAKKDKYLSQIIDK